MSDPFENELINPNEEKIILTEGKIEQSKKRKKKWIIFIIVIMIFLMLGCLTFFLIIGLSAKKKSEKQKLNEVLFTNKEIKGID